MGKKRIEKYGHGEWEVEYAPGKIFARASNAGKVECTDERQTTGKALAVKLRLENKITTANGRDIAIISCYCVDKDDREIPDAQPFVYFSANDLGKVISTGSDISHHNSVFLPKRQMRAGRITVAVKVGNTSGTLKVYAKADGLRSAVINIPLN